METDDIAARPGLFVTGTDTGVGKTAVTLGIMRGLQRRGRKVVAMKPIASGCERTGDGLRNDDALQLQAQASVQLAYEQVNPYAFAPAIAPHVAAREAGLEMRVQTVVERYRAMPVDADCVLVEGVGGWLVPLDRDRTLEDLAKGLRLPVVLVVGMRLGCLNHALLTQRAVAASGLALAGWVANVIDPAMERIRENIETLRQWLPEPLLGQIPYLDEPRPGAVADYLDIGQLSF
ncbi:MAG: dethiobiotin synthase [Gammaproteobacteria bacterium]